MLTLYKLLKKERPQLGSLDSKTSDTFCTDSKILKMDYCHPGERLKKLMHDYIHLCNESSSSNILNEIQHKAAMAAALLNTPTYEGQIFSAVTFENAAYLPGIGPFSKDDRTKDDIERLSREGFQVVDVPVYRFLGWGRQLNPYMFDGSAQGFAEYLMALNPNIEEPYTMFPDELTDYILEDMAEAAEEALSKADPVSALLNGDADPMKHYKPVLPRHPNYYLIRRGVRQRNARNSVYFDKFKKREPQSFRQLNETAMNLFNFLAMPIKRLV